jgi:hypothetical protein
VEYAVSFDETPPPDAEAPFAVTIRFYARYDASERDATAYDDALAALRDLIAETLMTELRRAAPDVEWRAGE